MPSHEELEIYTEHITSHIEQGVDIPLQTMMEFIRDPRVFSDMLGLDIRTKKLKYQYIFGEEAANRWDDMVDIAITGLRHFKTEYIAEDQLSRSRAIANPDNTPPKNNSGGIRTGGRSSLTAHRRSQ